MMISQLKGGITSPQGFKAAGVKAGIKKSGKYDIGLIYSTVKAGVAAVFTTNAFAAPPIQVSKSNVEHGSARAIIVNSGQANACTGRQGILDARTMVNLTAQLLGIDTNEVIVASTGVIGVTLPMDKVSEGIRKAVADLGEDTDETTAQAIMTTDTFPKSCAYEFAINGTTARIAGIAKGSGMIHPNMATMLAFITTDVNIDSAVLKQALSAAVNKSFNMITVDGDTSTNDCVAILANGLAGNSIIDSSNAPGYQEFYEALLKVCMYLAKMIVKDGEGATKFIEIEVRGAQTVHDAKSVAMAVAKSPLVKTAFFGEDPNWGRILCAAGYSGAHIDSNKVSLVIGGIQIVAAGKGIDYDEDNLKSIMAKNEIVVEIDLGVGTSQATVWTCDMSYEYVKINGEYRT